MRHGSILGNIIFISGILNRTRSASLGKAGYRGDIDGLRAIAIMLVVAFHTFPTVVPSGFIGVDVFFVISGYLIGTILLTQLERGTFSFIDFYARRIKRIFPALLLVILFCYGVGWFYLIDTEYKELGKEIAGGVAFVANLVLWHDAGYFDAAAATKPLLHLWSLSVEEQFYLFWPLLLWVCGKIRIDPVVPIVLVGVGSFGLNLATLAAHPVADFYSPLTRVWEMMLGCALSYWQWRRPHKPARYANAYSTIGCALIVAALVLMRSHAEYPGWRALLPTVGTMLLIAGGPGAWVNRHVLPMRPLVALGLISYPLYLWHWPLLVFCRILSLDVPPWHIRLLVVGLAVMLAWVTFQWVELPIRFGQRQKWTAVTLIGLLTIMGLQGYNTYRREGLEFRLGHMLSQFAHVQHDVGPAWREHICFLGGQDPTDAFDASCVDAGDAPIALLWGDSHAAALYPGLRALQSDYVFRIAEYAGASCPPLFGTDAPNSRCAAINQNVLARIASIQPRLVILTADWKLNQAPKIADTVQTLRKSGVTHIALIGPVPAWRDPLPKVYWLYWRRYHKVLPARTPYDLSAQTVDIDRQIRSVADDLNVPYISAVEALCNSAGCLTRTGQAKGELLAFDRSHLTPSASTTLMRTIASPLLGSLFLPHSGAGTAAENPTHISQDAADPE